MKLPSLKYVSSNTPIYPGSNFTWGEATKNCTRPIQDLYKHGRLIQSASQTELRIIGTAHYLDKLREDLGHKPIFVNSWYRPSKINARIGGSTYSRHQFGDGVDIRSAHFSPLQIYRVAEPNHNGGISRYRNHVHIDYRGTRARW